MLSNQRLKEIRGALGLEINTGEEYRVMAADLLAEVDRLRAPAKEAWLADLRIRVDSGGFVFTGSVPGLLAALNHAEGLLCDLLTDPGEPASAAYQAGAAAERERIMGVLPTQNCDIANDIRELPPLPPPLPPEQARQYASRLADWARRVLENWESADVGVWAGLRKAGKRLLEEGE